MAKKITPSCHCGNNLPCRTHTGMDARQKEDYGKTPIFIQPKENEPQHGMGWDDPDPHPEDD